MPVGWASSGSPVPWAAPRTPSRSKASQSWPNYKRIFKGYKRLLKNARGKEVTVKMVKKELKFKCSVKTLSRAFWAHGVHFRSLYEKPDLSPQDVKDRLAWALAHAHRSPAQWGRALVVKLGSFKF